MLVKRMLQLTAILLAALWLPITAHCSLETLPGLEFLLCESDTSENDCSEDVCAQIERPGYKVSDTETLVPEPQLTLWFDLVFTETIPADSPQPSTASPAEIPFAWQFSFRAALPPRAPSLVS
jgi:hypothetical protein